MDLSIPQIALMSRLLDEALPLDSLGRRLWLERLSPEYQDLAEALRQALLPADSLPPVKLQKPSGGSAAAADGLQVGARVGPYELIRRLGAGGMGEVWLARRADGAFKREVALKLPTLNRARADLEQRFIRERDILATLEHPNIARFYDAGVDDGGSPYFAMEYVQGRALTTWCDTHSLSLSARVELFAQVVKAVQYAHEKHVVHRDLKPSNILVTESGQVSLLDFGIAKLLEAPDADEAQLTRAYGRVLTPDYASPELLRGDPVDARSDIYSLGVVLYELLCGVRPHQLQRVAELGLPAHGISTGEAKKPSALVGQAELAGRATTNERLARQLRGDLDAIALKSLAVEPVERYASASALAEDLKSYLAGKPVGAQPGKVAYRLRKFVRRNKPVVAVTAIALVAILAIGGYTLYERADRARTATNAVAVSAPTGARGGTTGTTAPATKSIAVLPFVDMSEKHDQEYFSDGLSEELINHLSHNPDLKVIARTSSFQFKGKNEDVRSIANQLGVAHLLEGSVRKAGNALRISTQLIRASDGVHLWSETYDRSLADIFKVQDEISEKVAAALNATLASADRPVGERSDVEAYNLVLEGNYYKVRRTHADVEKALQLYKKAIDIDPNYALAWARLAAGYLTLEEAKATPSPEDDAKIVDALDRAIRLDPNLVWAYYTRAGFEIAIKWDWAAAQADHERMRALDPGSYLLPLAMGDMALISGQTAEAIRDYERAIELNPLDPISLRALGVALCASERLEECLQSRLKLQQLHPELRGINAFVGEAHLLLAQFSEALEAMQHEPEDALRLAGIAMVYAAMGMRSESDAAVKTLANSYGEDAAFELSQVHAYRGERTAAFDWLQSSVRMRNSKILFIKTDPLLRNLRTDPRFQTLLTQLRLPD